MPTPPDASAAVIAEKRDAFLDRMLQSTRGTFEMFSIYLGVRLRFYEALARPGLPIGSISTYGTRPAPSWPASTTW